MPGQSLRRQLCSCPFGTHEARDREPDFHRHGCLVREHQVKVTPGPRLKWVPRVQAWIDAVTGKAFPVHAVAWNLHNLPDWSLRDAFCLPRDEALTPSSNQENRAPSSESAIGWAPDYY